MLEDGTDACVVVGLCCSAALVALVGFDGSSIFHSFLSIGTFVLHL